MIVDSPLNGDRTGGDPGFRRCRTGASGGQIKIEPGLTALRKFLSV